MAGPDGKLGYKISGFYTKADDWALDPDDGDDAAQILIDGVRDTDYEKLNLNGALEYRFSDTGSIAVNGGFATLGTVTLDTGVPGGTLGLAPNPAARGATITVRFQADEPLRAAPILSVTKPGGATFEPTSPQQDALVYTWSYALADTDPDGTWRLGPRVTERKIY